MDGQEIERRRHLERQAVLLFLGSATAMAVVCGAVIVSGWFAGVIQDRYERVFWAGAALSWVAVVAFAAAAFPGGASDARAITRVSWLIRAGLVLFAVAPTLCILALVADFFW